MSELESADEMTPPTVEVQTMPRYFCDAPMLVRLTVRAAAPDMIYMGLPVVQWFDDPFSAEWTIRTEAGEVLTAGVAEPSANSSYGAEFGLDPGDEHQTLVDLAALLHEVPPGRHALTVTYPVDGPVPSAPVTLNVECPNEAERRLIRQVRDGTGGDASWNDFFAGDWKWAEKAPLDEASDEVSEALSLHLYLHRAFYGDLGVKGLDVEPLEAMTDPLLVAEAAVLRHEIVHAAGQPVASQWKAYVAKHWPGLVWRVEKSEAGFGFLKTQRDACQQRFAIRPTDEIDSVLRP